METFGIGMSHMHHSQDGQPLCPSLCLLSQTSGMIAKTLGNSLAFMCVFVDFF